MSGKFKVVGLLAVGALAGALTTMQLQANARNAMAPLPLEEMQQLAAVFGIVRNEYVEPVDEKKLISDAIAGMVAGLDPHSQYFDKKSFKEFRESTGGKFVGLGIEVSMEDGLVKVVSPIEGSPAFRVGLKPGDLITRIDQTAVKGLSLNEAVKRMRPQEPDHDASVTVTLEDPRAGRTSVQRYYITPSYASAKPGEAEALDLLARIAADGTTGRIYKQLVVDKNVAASAGGWYADSGLDSGRIGFYAIAGEENTPEEMTAAMDEVVKDLRENGVTQDELDRARTGLLAEYVYNSDSISRMARQYGWRLSVGLSLDDVEAWPDRIKAVTVNDVRNVARKYLVDENSVTGILKPAPRHTTSVEEKQVPASGNGRS